MPHKAEGRSKLQQEAMIGAIVAPAVECGVGIQMGTGLGRFVLVPRCLLAFRRVEDGIAVECMSADSTASRMICDLAVNNANGTIGLAVTKESEIVASCRWSGVRITTIETADGIRIECTSDETDVRRALQITREYFCAMLELGGVCCVLLNGTPVCAGVLDTKAGDATESEAIAVACPGSETSEESEEPEYLQRISPLAFLRSFWAITFGAFRHPFTTTFVDLSTGKSVNM
jgi:hypothetical protein